MVCWYCGSEVKETLPCACAYCGKTLTVEVGKSSNAQINEAFARNAETSIRLAE